MSSAEGLYVSIGMTMYDLPHLDIPTAIIDTVTIMKSQYQGARPNVRPIGYLLSNDIARYLTVSGIFPKDRSADACSSAPGVIIRAGVIFFRSNLDIVVCFRKGRAP